MLASLLSPALLLLLPALAMAEPSTVTVLHRHLPTSLAASAPLPAWTPRLSLHLDSPGADASKTVVTRVEELAQEQPVGARDGWYQLSLEGSDDFTSVRACHLDLASDQQEVFTLHPASSNGLHQLDYALKGIARDGSCHSKSSKGGRKGDVIVRVFDAQTPTPLILGAPPPVDTTTGQPVVPPPEKSFIQKYWMYMAIPLVLMMVLPEGDAPPAAK